VTDVCVPRDERERADAIRHLWLHTNDLDVSGAYMTGVDLLRTWYEALEAQVPEDELARVEVAALLGWLLYKAEDAPGGERTLLYTLSGARKLADRHRSELAESPGDAAVEWRCERADRASGTCANFLGLLYLDTIGDVQAARELLQEALELRSKYPADVFLRAQTLANLGILEDKAGDLVLARQKLAEALDEARAIPETRGGIPDAELTAYLAGVDDRLGDRLEAERGLRSAFAIVDAAAPGDSRQIANIAESLGGLLWRQGRLREAEVWLRYSLGVYMRTVGERSPLYASAVDSFTMLLWDDGRVMDAIEIFNRTQRVSDVSLRLQLEIGSEQIRLGRTNDARVTVDFWMSIASEFAHREPSVAMYAFDAVLRRKGLVSEIFALQRSRRRKPALDSLRKLNAELEESRASLAEAVLGGRDRASEIAELRAKINQDERLIGVVERVV
jgi:tetratricopeptide (TPR) repeat protein